MVSAHDCTIKYNASFFDVVKNDRSTASGEAVIRSTQQVTKPFIKKHFRIGTFPSDSDLKPGYLLRRNHINHLVLERTEHFDGKKIAYYDAAIYKLNFSGEIQRFVATQNEIGETIVKSPIEKNVEGVFNEFFQFQIEKQPGEIEFGRWGLFIPAYVSGEIGDQVIINSGEIDRYDKYQIMTVDKGATFDNIKLVTLENDTRD